MARKKLLRRREKVGRKSKRLGTISRRRVLGMLGGAGALLMIGQCGRFCVKEHGANIRRANTPIITALREGKSVKQVIDNWPRIEDYEMSFHKKKGTRGKIWATVGERSRMSGGVISHNPPTAESTIHTHPVKSDNKKIIPKNIRKRSHSIASSTDVIKLLREHRSTRGVQRFLHIAAINERGETIGYFTVMVQKKLSNNPDALDRINVELHRLRRKFVQLYKDEKWQELENNFDLFLEKFGEWRDDGLAIRTTPMPSYHFRDGQFQKHSIHNT